MRQPTEAPKDGTMHRRLAAAVALSAALLLSACTDDAPQPPSPPSDGPKMPTSSPPSASLTPSPSPSVDQDASDKAAVAEAYRTQFAEFNRLEMAGGATKPSAKLRETTSGVYQRALMTGLRMDKRHGIRQLNSGKLVGVVVDGGTRLSRKVTACEDYSHTKWVKRDGSTLKVDQPILYVQHSTAKRGSDGKWRIDYTSTSRVKSFKRSVCSGDDQ